MDSVTPPIVATTLYSVNPMEQAQLSFLETLAPEPSKSPSVWEKLAAGLKRDRMGRLDREDYLVDQVRKLNQPDTVG